MPWSTVWDLPEPFGSVLVTESALRHVFNEHADKPWEPWESFLGTLLLRQYRDCWGQPDGARHPVLSELASLMGAGVRRGVDRPLFLTYEQLDERYSFLHATYEVITPSGLLVVIRQNEGKAELKTAFFPREAWSARPSRRWLGTVRSRVEMYAVSLLIAGRPVLGLPAADYEVPSQDPLGLRRNIKFESLRVWDFREVVLPDREDALILWGTHPLGWPAEAATGEKTTGSHPLKKRKPGSGKS